MKILLISPIISDIVKREKGLTFPNLALFIIESLTPSCHTVVIVEEEIKTIPFAGDFDLIGISCMTANAPRAYTIADMFRSRGIKVIMGGIHPTILYDEALGHADSVVIGEVEGVWSNVLEDVSSGKLQPKYNNPRPDLGAYNRLRYHDLIRKPYFILPVLTTRGCPYDCDFCSVSKIYGRKIRHIPISNVVRHISDSKCKRVIFYDDNIIGHSSYSMELFNELKPLRIKWGGQSTISLTDDDDMIDAVAASGCSGLLIGLESISEPQLSSIKKSLGTTSQIRTALRKIMKKGILIHVTMIFGFDTDSAEIFRETVKFLQDCKVSSVSFCILTPLPGTRVYEKMLREGRLLTGNWAYYNNRTVVYKPNIMSPYELQLRNWEAKKEFYSFGSIFRRLSGNMNHSAIHLISNVSYIGHVASEKRRIKGLNEELFQNAQC